MKKLYRIQQRLGMTRTEAAAISVCIGLFLLGSGVRGWNAYFQEAPSFDYQEVDSLFSAAATRLQSDLAAGTALLAGAADGSPININTAGSLELQRLPRIGPALAGRIIEYRERHGGFSTVDELTKVSGIGARTLETLRPMITTSAADSTG